MQDEDICDIEAGLVDIIAADDPAAIHAPVDLMTANEEAARHLFGDDDPAYRVGAAAHVQSCERHGMDVSGFESSSSGSGSGRCLPLAAVLLAHMHRPEGPQLQLSEQQ